MTRRQGIHQGARCEQRGAPLERRQERLLTGRRRMVAADQEPEPVVQAGGDLLDRQRSDASRRELQR